MLFGIKIRKTWNTAVWQTMPTQGFQQQRIISLQQTFAPWTYAVQLYKHGEEDAYVPRRTMKCENI
jgi:hypothetical protein